MEETLEEAAARELEEETGLKGLKLRQLKAFSAIHRDPRARTIAVAFYGFVDDENSKVKGADDAAEARWFVIDELPELAFDHEDIFNAALRKIM